MEGLLESEYRVYVSMLSNVLRLITADVSTMLYMPTFTPHYAVSVASEK